MIKITSVAVLATTAFLGASVSGNESAAGETEWKHGAPVLSSAGALDFGPGGVLFVADTVEAAVLAIRTGDAEGDASQVQIAVENIDEAIADLLGTSKDKITIHDLAVNPESGKAYLSVSRGRGESAQPVLIRVDGEGQLSQFVLDDVDYTDVGLPNIPEDGRRTESITDIEFMGDRVIVAGLSNEEFASKLRSLTYPFDAAAPGTSVEIYHGAHGAYETRAPVRTLTSYEIDGVPNVLAAYTCTPLVVFPVSDLEDGKKIRGTTIAELGNRNRPLDMVIYTREGQDYLLIANSHRGVMKAATASMGKIEGITSPVSGGKSAGLEYETIDYLQGVVQMDRLDDEYVVVLMEKDGRQTLMTVETP